MKKREGRGGRREGEKLKPEARPIRRNRSSGKPRHAARAESEQRRATTSSGWSCWTTFQLIFDDDELYPSKTSLVSRRYSVPRNNTKRHHSPPRVFQTLVSTRALIENDAKTSMRIESRGLIFIFVRFYSAVARVEPLIRATMIYHREAWTHSKSPEIGFLSTAAFSIPPRRSFPLPVHHPGVPIPSLISPMNNFRVGRVARPTHARGCIDWRDTRIHSRNHEREPPYRVGRSWPASDSPPPSPPQVREPSYRYTWDVS